MKIEFAPEPNAKSLTIHIIIREPSSNFLSFPVRKNQEIASHSCSG